MIFATEPLRLIRWMYTRAWLSAERPTVLFDLVTARLIECEILLPGVTVLTRLVAQVRERATTRLWQRLAALPGREQTAQLEALLVVRRGRILLATGPAAPCSYADQLSGVTGSAGARGRDCSLGVSGVDLSRFPAGRIKIIARNTATAWTQTLARLQPARRIASLLVFAHVYEAVCRGNQRSELCRKVLPGKSRRRRDWLLSGRPWLLDFTLLGTMTHSGATGPGSPPQSFISQQVCPVLPDPDREGVTQLAGAKLSIN